MTVYLQPGRYRMWTNLMVSKDQLRCEPPKKVRR